MCDAVKGEKERSGGEYASRLVASRLDISLYRERAFQRQRGSDRA